MTINEKYDEQSIRRLDIKDEILNKLEDKKINTLGKLCRRSKSDLKKVDLNQKEIEKVEIELQLMGLNLKNSL